MYRFAVIREYINLVFRYQILLKLALRVDANFRMLHFVSRTYRRITININVNETSISLPRNVNPWLLPIALGPSGKHYRYFANALNTL